MDPKLKKICGLLQSQDPLRCTAAAIVLAELAPGDAAVVRALGEALPGANQTLTTAILDAFDAIGSRTALPFLLPLLDTEDLAVKMRAMGAITKTGAAALPLIRPLLANASPSKTLVLVDLLARIPTGDAMRALLSLLPNADPALTTEIAEALHRHARPMSPATRGTLHKLVAQFMNSAAVKQSERLQGACLLLLGALARPEARAILLRWTEPRHPPRLRLQALRGLQNLEWTPATAKPIITKLRPYMTDPDAELAQQSLRVLAAVPVATLTSAQWRALLDGPTEPLRSLALSRLLNDTSAAGTRVLVDLLRHPSGQIREAAATTLARQAGAAATLLDALLHEDDAERTWNLAKILKPHAATLSTRDRKRLTERASRSLNAASPIAEPLLYLLRQADGPAADKLSRDMAFTAVRAEKWANAVAAFLKFLHGAGFDDNCRYALCLANLKLSPKELAPQLRSDDHALRGFQTLLRNPNSKLLARLTKEKALEAEDLYYVGFHFSDMPGLEREFGEALLHHVAKRWPRSPSGKAAKSKLGIATGTSTKSRRTAKKS